MSDGRLANSGRSENGVGSGVSDQKMIAFVLTVVFGIVATTSTTAGSTHAAPSITGPLCVGGSTWAAFQPVPKVPTSPHQQARKGLTTVQRQPRLWRCAPVPLFRQPLALRAQTGEARQGTLSRDVLECMSRRQLQEVAKSKGVRANLKSADIVEQLLVLQRGDASECALKQSALSTTLISLSRSHSRIF